MDPYENDELESVEVPEAENPQPRQAPKTSPFADSPYVNAAQPQQETAPEKPKKSRSGAGRRILAAVLTVALVAGSCLITAAAVNEKWEDELDERIEELEERLNTPKQSPYTTDRPVPADGDLLTPDQLYTKSVSSVVAITGTVQTVSPFGTNTGTSSGSGFILTGDGYVVTNHHVIDGAASLAVTTYDGTSYPAKLVGSNADNDVAILKIEAQELTPVTLGSSDDLAIGDMVVAIGNAMGRFASTQTVGYVSGKNRDVVTSGNLINMIQSDVAINPGNSGGPLFNMRGEVVGITTAKWSGTSSSGATVEGIGFAIPIDDVKDMFSDLIDYGYVTGAYLGISVKEMNSETAAAYGLPVGAYVAQVTEGSCAQKAGLQEKDIITALGEYEVSGINELTRALRKFKPGDTTKLTVFRGGASITLTITLDAKPAPQSEVPMPSDGDYQEWYDYFSKFFNN